MNNKNTEDFKIPTYDEFKRDLLPLAMNIAKSQNLSNTKTTFSDIERVEMAINDAYLKINCFNPSKGAKLTTYFYSVLKNTLCTVPSYDKVHLCLKPSNDRDEEFSAIIKGESKLIDIDLENPNQDENMLEEDEDSFLESVEDFERGLEYLDGQSTDYAFNPYDIDDCFVMSFEIALNELPKSNQLILTGDKREYVRVNGVLYDDKNAWENFYSHNKGTLVFKGLSRTEIGKILNYSAGNVGYIRNSLASQLAVSMSKIFVNVYLGSDPQKTFCTMLEKYKHGDKIVKKNKLSL